MSLRDLAVEIGVEFDGNPLQDLDRAIDDINRAFEGLGDSLSMNSVTRDIDDAADAMYDLEHDTRDAERAVEHLDRADLNSLERETKKADSAFSGLKGTIIGVAAGIASFIAVDKIIDFGKGAIEAAAGAQAVNAQFEQVFADLGPKAQETVDGLADSFGMLPNRIKPSFTMMTSMFKGLGLETEDAMGASERAVTAIADSAAFYDKSFEDANSSLNSFIKGNYEGGEQIGLFANETQLAAFAAKELDLDWKKLGEADKQLARLTFAEKMLESAGATGQALRESESYENQLGNLKQAWQDFMAKAGAPILEQVVGVMSELADVVSTIDPGPFMTFISEGIGKLAGFKDVFLTIKDTYVALFSGDVSGVGSLWEKLGFPPELANMIQYYVQNILDKFNLIKTVIMGFVNDVIIPLMPLAKEAISSAMGSISGIIGSAMSIFDSIKAVITSLIMDVAIPLFPVFKEVLATVFSIAAPIIRMVATNFRQVASVVKFLVMDIVIPLLPLIATHITNMWTVAKPILGFVAGAFNAVADAIDWVIGKVDKVAGVLGKLDIGSKISGAVSAVSGFAAKFGFDTGIGRVPHDMVAQIHKDEAVIPVEEADALRNAGILKGDGRYPTVDVGVNKQLVPTAVQTSASGGATSIEVGGIEIVVQGGNTNADTGNAVKQAIEEAFANLLVQMKG